MNKTTLVLGMHRSGTSLLARIINIIGLYLNEEQLLSPYSDNPQGFWEDERLVRLNDCLLQKTGGWLYPREHRSYDFTNSNNCEEKAIELIEEYNHSSQFWIWKDPRLCLTLPFWKDKLPPCLVLFIYRNPLEVYQSLNKRNGIGVSALFALWEQYCRQALTNSVNYPRMILSYNSLISDAAEAVEKITDFFIVNGISLGAIQMDRIKKVINPSLKHHTYKDTDFITHEYATKSQIKLYQLLMSNTLQDSSELPERDNPKIGIPELFTYVSTIEHQKAELTKVSSQLMHYRKELTWLKNHPYVKLGRKIKRLISFPTKAYTHIDRRA